MKNKTKIIWLLFFISVVFITWHAGRTYQGELDKKAFLGKFDNSIVTYYFLNPEVVDPELNATQDLYIYGEIDLGRCIPFKYDNS